MKKILLAAMLTVATGVSAQSSDPVVMVINNKPVYRSEFAYSYKKNNGPDVIDHKTVDEYVDLFVNYKLKVEAALDAHIDTATSYKKEFRQYRDQQVLPTLIVDADVENEARRIYNDTKQRIGADGLVNPQHILIRVGQNDDAAKQEAARQKADDIYRQLIGGAVFADMARQYSEDQGTAKNGGEVGFISKGQTLKAFENVAFSLQQGQLAKPVLSEVGYHIIYMKERKQLEPYETLRNDIYEFIDKQRVREHLAAARLQEIARINGVAEETVMDQRADSISALSPEMKYLIKEYHDGLLLFEVSKREVWDVAANDEKGLLSFFKKNKSKYKWDEPRFKGIAFHTRTLDDVAEVRKSVKGKKFSEWTEILRNTFNRDSVLRIRAEKGVFKKGDNGIVDRDEFGIADAKVRSYKDFGYTATYGRIIKAPEEMNDVRSLVVADFQDLCEKQWVEELRKRYPVKVNFDVVDTVK